MSVLCVVLYLFCHFIIPLRAADAILRSLIFFGNSAKIRKFSYISVNPKDYLLRTLTYRIHLRMHDEEQLNIIYEGWNRACASATPESFTTTSSVVATLASFTWPHVLLSYLRQITTRNEQQQ